MSSFGLLKKLAGETVVYGVSGVVSRFISIFLTPIYTGIFAPADYGLVSLVATLSALLGIVLILGLDSGLARWYYESEDQTDRRTTINTFLWSCLSVAVLLAFATIVGRDLIAAAILREPSVAPLLLLMGINLPLTVFQVFTVNVLRMQRRARATAVFTLTTSLLTIALSLLFVVVWRFGIFGVFYAQIGTSLVAAVWTFVLFRREMSVRLFDFGRWRSMFLFGAPLIPATVAYWVINVSGAYFIQLMSSTHEVGLFQIATTLASAMALVSGAFQLAWGPFAYSIHKRPEAKQIYAQVLLLFLAVTCALSLGLMLFAPEILMILTNPNYYDAAFVAGLLAFNHVLLGLTYIACIGVGIAKNTGSFGVSMLVSATLLVGLNLVLVPLYGKEGAAAAILLSQTVVPLAVFAHGQKIYPIPYKFGKAAFILISSFVCGVGCTKFLSISSFSTGASVAIKILLLLVYGAAVFAITKNEIKPNDLLALETSAV